MPPDPTDDDVPNDVQRVAIQVLEAATLVHSELGPGVLARAYRACLRIELEEMGLEVHERVPVPVRYRGRRVGIGLEVDLVVGDRCIVVLASPRGGPGHELDKAVLARARTALRLTGRRLALVVNVDASDVQAGARRVVR